MVRFSVSACRSSSSTGTGAGRLHIDANTLYSMGSVCLQIGQRRVWHCGRGLSSLLGCLALSPSEQARNARWCLSVHPCRRFREYELFGEEEGGWRRLGSCPLHRVAHTFTRTYTVRRPCINSGDTSPQSTTLITPGSDPAQTRPAINSIPRLPYPVEQPLRRPRGDTPQLTPRALRL